MDPISMAIAGGQKQQEWVDRLLGTYMSYQAAEEEEKERRRQQALAFINRVSEKYGESTYGGGRSWW
jgi:hypothetical protein